MKSQVTIYVSESARYPKKVFLENIIQEYFEFL